MSLEEVHDSVWGDGDPVGNVMHEKALREAAREAVRDEFAVTDGWKPKPELTFVIECPSGQRCLAKKLTTLDLVDADLIEEMDFFSKQLFPADIDESGNPVEREKETTLWDILRDAKKKCRFMSLLNRLLETAIVKPKVVNDGVELIVKDDKTVLAYGTRLRRDLREGEVAASAIDFDDKMVIFGRLNAPMEEIKTFRTEQETSLASLAASESVKLPT